MTEEELIEAAIRAGEEAAADDFKLKYEQAQAELVEVRKKLAEAEEVRDGADAKVRDAQDRVARACRRTGRISAAARPPSAWRSATAQPRSS